MEPVLAALASMTEPYTLAMLATGVLIGLVIGVIPGLGGIFGLSLLVPLTYQMEPVAAFALLLGLGSVITTSDTIPAVLIGVPGSVGAIATVEDGHPLAKQNQAARAFGAAYSASLIGGLFGALVLAASIPVMQPMILALRTPDFLAIAILGLLFVGILSGDAPLKGLLCALLGMSFAFVGIDTQTATQRFTFGDLYLWEGLPLAVVFLGLFGLPALVELAQRSRVIADARTQPRAGLLQGIGETLRNWKLVAVTSASGSALGAIPGIGLPVIEWVAYGIGKRMRRGGPDFGKGNIQGVIAPEAANNAKEGGALIPTIALGLPGSASMTLLLGAMIVHGLTPGREMLTTELHVTYTMVFFVAAANVMATLICLGFTRQLARIALLPSAIIVPASLVFITLGAYQTHASLKDIAVLLCFGAIGYFMKERNWPRAAFSLGFVLGPTIERYYFLSEQLTDGGWIYRPSIIIVAAIFLFFLLRKMKRNALAGHGSSTAGLTAADLAGAVTIIGLSVFMMLHTAPMPVAASQFPQIVAGTMLALAALLTLRIVMAMRAAPPATGDPVIAGAPYLALILGGSAFIVLLVNLAGFVAAAAFFAGGVALAGRIRPVHALLAAAIVGSIAWTTFGMVISVPWPDPVIWRLLPG